MKYMYALFLAIGLTGCLEPETPAEKEQKRIQRIEESKRRIQQMQMQATACDKNDGIKDVVPGACGRGGCGQTVIICNDGMQRNFDVMR